MVDLTLYHVIEIYCRHICVCILQFLIFSSVARSDEMISYVECDKFMKLNGFMLPFDGQENYY